MSAERKPLWEREAEIVFWDIREEDGSIVVEGYVKLPLVSEEVADFQDISIWNILKEQDPETKEIKHFLVESFGHIIVKSEMPKPDADTLIEYVDRKMDEHLRQKVKTRKAEIAIKEGEERGHLLKSGKKVKIKMQRPR